MPHTKHPFVVLPSVLVAFALVAMGVVFLRGREMPTTAGSLVVGMEEEGGEMEEGGEGVGGVEGGEVAAGDGLARVEGTTTVGTAGFWMDVPESWVVSSMSADGNRLADGALAYGTLYNKQSDVAYGGDPDALSIHVSDYLKEGASFDEMVATLSWDAGDVEEIVAFMREEAADIFPDYSESDVLTSVEADEINGMAAARATLQCLKPCYIEGGANTTVRYVVDAPDRVYVLRVTVGTLPTAPDLLNEADAIIRTFQLN